MRVVIDTNVLVSGLLWRGPPHTVIEYIRDGTLTFVTSPALLAEFDDVIHRPKFRTILSKCRITPDELLEELRQLAELIIDPTPLLVPVCRDPDDDAVLALAVAGQADLIVSGNSDLLTLGAYDRIRIIDAATCVAEIDW